MISFFIELKYSISITLKTNNSSKDVTRESIHTSIIPTKAGKINVKILYENLQSIVIGNVNIKTTKIFKSI